MIKNVIIKINDISDIDTAKISVYDLNNRYVDAHGNMYGLKYNKELRKIDVIKILRTHEKNASTFQQQIIQKKRGDLEASMNGDEGSSYNVMEHLDNNDVIYNPEAFIEKTVELARTHKDRIKGIIMNIKNSNFIAKDNKTESNQLDDIFRNLEIDGMQAIDEVSNYQKELINYPRSISFYQAKADDRGRHIIESLATDTKKVMRFIYLSEMLDNIMNLYKHIEKLIKDLKTFLDEKNPEDAKWVTMHEKQSFKDGMVSITTTLADIEKLHGELKKLEDYIYTNPLHSL